MSSTTYHSFCLPLPAAPGSGLSDGDKIRKLHAILRPFLLRRLKSDVEKALPPKTEMKLFIGMSKVRAIWGEWRVMTGVAEATEAAARSNTLRHAHNWFTSLLLGALSILSHVLQVQKQLYKNILNKDSAALNAMGGPDRSRLLNTLMQLRKVRGILLLLTLKADLYC